MECLDTRSMIERNCVAAVEICQVVEKDVGIGSRMFSTKGVDDMMVRLGLSVIDRNGHEVKLFDYIEEENGDGKGLEKISYKGKRKLRNLKWDIKEKENVDSNIVDKRATWGKKIVHL